MTSLERNRLFFSKPRRRTNWTVFTISAIQIRQNRTKWPLIHRWEEAVHLAAGWIFLQWSDNVCCSVLERLWLCPVQKIMLSKSWTEEQTPSAHIQIVPAWLQHHSSFWYYKMKTYAQRHITSNIAFSCDLQACFNIIFCLLRLWLKSM